MLAKDGEQHQIEMAGHRQQAAMRRDTDRRVLLTIAQIACGLPPEKWSSLMYGLWPDGGLKNAKEETHG